MNLILFRPHEALSGHEARLSGERARHVREVLKAEVGSELRVGIADLGEGVGVITALSEEDVTISYSLDSEPDLPEPVDLILAMPRPKVLRRILQHAASLSVRRVLLLNSWRVEKSYFKSPVLDEAILRENLIVGLEQAGRSSLPSVRVVDRFRPFVEDELDDWCDSARRVLLHPGAPDELSSLTFPRECPIAVAIGPEGGWIPFEVEQLTQRGFCPAGLGRSILRVEVAVVAAISGIHLLRR